MKLRVDLIVEYIRLFVTNMYVYYCFEKIVNNKEKHIRNNIILIIVNSLLLLVCVPIKDKFDLVLPFIFFWFIYTIVISRITKNKLGYSMLVTIVAYAITFACQSISVFIQFIPYKILEQWLKFDNKYVSLTFILISQLTLIYGFFKIKRFRNGFSFLKNKLNNEVTDIIMINISTIIILVYCLLGTYYDHITWSLIISSVILCIVMFFTIRKMFAMYYKQKLLMDTMEEYKAELEEKQNEIDKLKSDKKNVSKITHEFYNRQKALELLVASNMSSENIARENVSPNVLKIIEALTNEYSNRFEEIKELPNLEKTDIPEIDNMFTYMQSECNKNGINFKLKIVGNIHTLVNNVITKNKLETLIGDHLRDAINAVNLSRGENKEILAVLGVKDKKYELSIFDTGVEFEIATLLKLGLEAITTNADRGGTGAGFMTTFETLNDTKASLIITEYPLTKDRYYTKSVTIRFDGKKQYRICSYRGKEIKEKSTDNRIKIVENKK